MRLGVRDWKVIEAFVDGRVLDGHKLCTDGRQLDGYWTGGRGIAEKVDGQIRLNDLGSRSAQSVHRAVRGMAAPMQIETHRDRTRRHRFAIVQPHGLCRAEHCVEHEQNPKIESCRGKAR